MQHSVASPVIPKLVGQDVWVMARVAGETAGVMRGGFPSFARRFVLCMGNRGRGGMGDGQGQMTRSRSSGIHV
jgi:hypothetical protein